MSNVSYNFKDSIKKWVKIDNKQKELRKLSSELKKKKDELQMFITEYMEDNNILKKNILISDGKIQYSSSETKQSINKKFIIDKLTVYFNSLEKATEVAEYLYNNRDTITKIGLKRLKSKK